MKIPSISIWETERRNYVGVLEICVMAFDVISVHETFFDFCGIDVV